MDLQKLNLHLAHIQFGRNTKFDYDYTTVFSPWNSERNKYEYFAFGLCRKNSCIG